MIAAAHRICCASHRGAALLAFAACIGTALPAAAYSASEAYVEPPASGGGGGRWFSGSPADGFSCGVCHLPAKGVRKFPLYVAGLPLDAGYTLASKQQIVLSWPEFATRWHELRPDPTVKAVPGMPSPAMSVVAELVAESGKGSGAIDIDSAAGPDELCEMTRPNLKPRLAAKLWQVRPGIDALQIKPDSTGVMHCEAHQLGQRCIVALDSCGAKQARFTWTAPSRWEGAIWFSAGFVASEALSGTPEGDSVHEVSLPVVQSGTPAATYQQTLHNGCTAPGDGGARGRSTNDAPALRGGASGIWGGIVLALCALRMRRRAARRTREHG